MIVWQNGAYTPDYLAQKERMDAPYDARGATKPFEVGTLTIGEDFASFGEVFPEPEDLDDDEE